MSGWIRLASFGGFTCAEQNVGPAFRYSASLWRLMETVRRDERWELLLELMIRCSAVRGECLKRANSGAQVE